MISNAAKAMGQALRETVRAAPNKITVHEAEELRAEADQLIGSLTRVEDRAYLGDTFKQIAQQANASQKARAVLLGRVKPQSEPIQIDERAAHKPITIKPGQQITVSLSEKSGSACRWTVVVASPALRAPAELNVIPDPRRLGTAVARSFIFTPDARLQRSGDTATIQLTFGQEAHAPQKILNFSFVVSA